MKPYFAHETAVIDPDCNIGSVTKIWHFSHVMSNCIICEKCNLGQNVVVSPEVIIWNNVKVQNNVSIYTGVSCEDCLLYTSPSPRDRTRSRMPSSA